MLAKIKNYNLYDLVLRVSRTHVVYLSQRSGLCLAIAPSATRERERAIVGIITTSGEVKRIYREQGCGSCNSSSLRHHAVVRVHLYKKTIFSIVQTVFKVYLTLISNTCKK